MLKDSIQNYNGLFMSLSEASTRKPFMVFYYKTTKSFVSRTVRENRLRFNFETFSTFSDNWNLFRPQSWKRGTLKLLVQRARLICSTEDLLKTELNHIKKVFLEENNFPQKGYKTNICRRGSEK